MRAVAGMLLLSLPIGLACGQRVDRSTPPRMAEGAGGFTVRSLSALPLVDGRTWIEVRDQFVSDGTYRAPNGQFTLTLEDKPENAHNVASFAIYFTDGNGTRSQLDPGFAVYTYITPDSRWIISDPLEAIDVTNWVKYSLSKALHIDSYVVMRAISPDGRRLVISRQTCAFDCAHIPDEYYEIGIP